MYPLHSRSEAPPQLPAFAVMTGPADRGRIPLRPDSAASFPKNLIFIYLSKNPVNLSYFIEIYGNSVPPGNAVARAHSTACGRVGDARNCGQMRRSKPMGRRRRPRRRDRLRPVPIDDQHPRQEAIPLPWTDFPAQKRKAHPYFDSCPFLYHYLIGNEIEKDRKQIQSIVTARKMTKWTSFSEPGNLQRRSIQKANSKRRMAHAWRRGSCCVWRF